MTCAEILRQLNPEQAEAVATIDGPVLVLAGAGTGKTRVITYRIAYMLSAGIPGASILGMTFTNKAAREMRERLARLVTPAAAAEVTLGTFHSFCGRLLRREIRRLGYLPNFTIADESDQLGIYKQAAGMLGCNHEGFPIKEAFGMMGRWKNRLITPNAAIQSADSTFEATAARIYDEYQHLLEMQNMVDFDDMLMLTWRIFKEHPEALEHCRARYRYLMVDEYQDTNAAQFTLVKMLAGESRNLCVVGDDDQSIYSWRGADIGNILDFPELFPGAKVVKLEQNYRSTSRILAAANAAIGGGETGRRHIKKLWSKLAEGEPPRLLALPDGESEAGFVADFIEQLRHEKHYSYSDFAILYRSNQLSRQLEQSLRTTGVPYRVYGGQQFYQRREIKDAVAYLRIIANPQDDQSLLRVLASPPRGLGAKAIEELKRRRSTNFASMTESLRDESFQNTLSKAGASGARSLLAACDAASRRFAAPGDLAVKIADFLKNVGYIDGLQRIYKDISDALKRRDNVDEFISAVAQFERNQGKPVTLTDYLESFSLLEESERVDEENAGTDQVTLSTIHAAKGLEFPVVFVIALERGIFPHERAIEEGAADEERRLFYVAITRAKQELYLLRAKVRMARGISRPAAPSPFLNLLDDRVAEHCEREQLLQPASADEMRQAFENIFKILNSEK